MFPVLSELGRDEGAMMKMTKGNPQRGLGSTTRTNALLVEAHQSTTNVETSTLDEPVLDPIDRGQGHLHAVRLERETGGKVTCEQMCPSVDWAFLRSSRHSSKSTTRRAG